MALQHLACWPDSRATLEEEEEEEKKVQSQAEMEVR